MKKLPILHIEGTDFEVDALHNVLIEKANPENILSVSDFVKLSDGYGFMFDKDEKNFPDPMQDRSNVVRCQIPFLTEIDPEAMAEKYDKDISEVIGKTDREVMVSSDAFQSRINGNLVTLDVLGDLYLLDLQKPAIVHHTGDPSKEISIYGLGLYRDKDKYFALPYDVANRTFLTNGANNNAKEVVSVRFPPFNVMDPIGYCRYGGTPLSLFIMENPLRAHYQAEIGPWEGMPMPKNIYRSEIDVHALIPRKELPTVNIAGIPFLVDVDRNTFLEKANPLNEFSLFDADLLEDGSGYGLWFDKTKKRPVGSKCDRNNDNAYIELGRLTDLDPEGMARKYGKSVDEVKGKLDIEVMVDATVYQKRVKYGQLPTIDIAGHLFYVDLKLNMLRPKDDFASKGIPFNKIHDYRSYNNDHYRITYNPLTHEFQEINTQTIVELPKDLILIQFPHQCILDPVGYSQNNNLSEIMCIMQYPPKLHFHAQVVPFETTPIMGIIEENKKRLGMENNTSNLKGKGRSNKL